MICEILKFCKTIGISFGEYLSICRLILRLHDKVTHRSWPLTMTSLLVRRGWFLTACKYVARSRTSAKDPSLCVWGTRRQSLCLGGSEKSEQHQHQAKGVSGCLPAGQVSSTKHQAPCTKHQSPGMTSEDQHQAKGVRGYLPAGLIRASIWRKREIIQNTTKANTKNTKRKASVETYLPVLLEPLCRNPGPRAFE